MSPPDLPPKELYKPLGELLQQVDRGHKFRPVTVKEVAAAKNTSQVSPLHLASLTIIPGIFLMLGQLNCQQSSFCYHS